MKASKTRRNINKFGIRDLIFVISIANVLVYLLSLFGNINLSLSLALIPSKVFEGEIWRLISYIFIPPTFNPFFLLIVIMFYVYIGRRLEEFWGTFKFNVYYFTGVIIITIVSLIFNVPVVGVSDLNMSLFLAYTILNPNQMVYLFMLIPVKMKYLAIVMLTILGYEFITAGFLELRIIILAPIINILIFFVPYFLKNTKRNVKARKRKEEFGKVIDYKSNKAIHRCTVCGLTEKDNENLEFRYCSKCDGNHEYCSEHIFNHEHI